MRSPIRWTLVFLLACTSTVRIEAERALSAGERLRKLSIEDQKVALGMLSGLGCEDRDVCLVRDACLRVVKPTLIALEHRRDGVAFKDAAEATDASAEAVRGNKERAGQLFDAAHAELEEAKAAVPECDAALAMLERAAKGK